MTTIDDRGLVGPDAISATTRVHLPRLRIGPLEDGEAEVGRPDGSVFVGVPQIGLTVLRLLAQGRTVGEAERDLAAENEVDVNDFVVALVELGMVDALEETDPGSPALHDLRPVASRADPRALGRWTPLKAVQVERLAWALGRRWRRVWYAVAILAWLVTPLWFVAVPRSLPTPSKVWIGGSLDAFANWAIFVVIGWVLVLVHELGHVFSLRALGEDSSLSISHRLYYVVAQTNMERARLLQRRQRYVPYLAGMTVDLIILLAAAIAFTLTGYSWRIFVGIGYMEVFGVTWQFAFFMRTDIYFVITNFVRAGDLMGSMRLVLRGGVARMSGRPQPPGLARVPLRERRIAAYYAGICVAGFGLVSWVVFSMNYPLLVRFVLATRGSLSSGPSSAAFWSAIAFLSVIGVYWGVFATIAARVVRERWSRWSWPGRLGRRPVGGMDEPAPPDHQKDENR